MDEPDKRGFVAMDDGLPPQAPKKTEPARGGRRSTRTRGWRISR